jgi:hypothetical protein
MLGTVIPSHLLSLPGTVIPSHLLSMLGTVILSAQAHPSSNSAVPPCRAAKDFPHVSAPTPVRIRMLLHARTMSMSRLAALGACPRTHTSTAAPAAASDSA